MDKTGFLIRLCTFNVLCETTKNKCAYLYGESTQQKINWDDRKQLLTNEITTLNADVFCLQEVQEDHYIDFYEPLFHRG
jgi:CCR4-NOT transcription complex subunit 6